MFKFIIPLLLTSCAIVTSTSEYADGRKVTTTIIEMGRTEAATDFIDTQTKDGRTISIGGVKSDVNNQAIKDTVTSLGTALGIAAKVYIGKP